MSRNDAAFFTPYHDCDPVWFSDDKSVVIYRNGEMRIHLTEPDGSTSVLRYTNDLDAKGLDTDEKLADAEKSGALEFHNNPWFEVVYHDNEEGEVFIGLDEAKRYAEGIVAKYAEWQEQV